MDWNECSSASSDNRWTPATDPISIIQVVSIKSL